MEHFKRLDELTDQGYLRRVVSPCKRLVLYSYSDKCAYEKKWNKDTINARGTVYELATGKIVARAFPKFWNFGELAVSKQRTLVKKTDYTITEKADGSLGIVYYYDSQWRVNTRGSFTSDQAIKATEMLEKYDLTSISKGATLLVEIIYPENRIILDYGKEEKLTLIGAFETETGREYDANTINMFSNFPVVDSRKITIPELISLQKTLPITQEGFVVRFSDGERVKFKGEEYLKVARVMSNSTPLELWRNMEDGKVNTEFLQGIPEEFETIIRQTKFKLESVYQEIKREIYVGFHYDLPRECQTSTAQGRKALGLYLKKNKVRHASAAFPWLLNKSKAIDKYIMKTIRPVGNVL